MQVTKDILKLVFFPGLLFWAICGGLLVFAEGRIRVAFYGGKGPAMLPAPSGRAGGTVSYMGEIAAAVFSLVSLGLAGYLLVGVKGDIFSLLLLLSVVELLPSIEGIRDAGDAARMPLAFRAGFARLGALFCTGVCVSLRFPAEFAAGLENFRGEGAFSALQFWGGLDYALVLAALVAAVLSLVLFHLGRPPSPYGNGAGEQGTLAWVHFLGIQGVEKAVTLLLFMVLFLGYPWEGTAGILVWSGAALGTVAVLTAARAWADGRDSATLRRWQEAGFVLAVLSFVLALAAAA